MRFESFSTKEPKTVKHERYAKQSKATIFRKKLNMKYQTGKGRFFFEISVLVTEPERPWPSKGGHKISDCQSQRF